MSSKILTIKTDLNLHVFSGDNLLGVKTEKKYKLQHGQLYLTEKTVKKKNDENQNDDDSEAEVQGKILWDGRSDKEPVIFPANFLIVDRRFRIGERVKCREVGGEIIRASEMATAYVHDHKEDLDIISTEILVRKLKPLTNCFYGVNVELNGWIGTIIKVQRIFELKFEDGTKCFIHKTEPQPSKEFILIGEKIKKLKLIEPASKRWYPFINGISNLLAPGIITRLSRKFLKNNAIWDPDTCKVSVLEAWKKYANKKATVVSCKTWRVGVDWLGRISNTKEPEPRYDLLEPEKSKLRYFYIHPSTYLYKKGLCSYKLEEEQIVSQESWENLMKVLLESDQVDESTPAKRMKSKIPPGQILTVSKHILTHLYEVKWDNMKETSLHHGPELQMENLHHSNFLPVYIFVKRNPRSERHYKEYGVIIRRVNEYKVQVQWLNYDHDRLELEPRKGPVTEEVFLDLIQHKRFNQLHIGKHVRRNSYYERENGFQFGTVITIDRYKLGTVTVYCCLDQIEKNMWPYELDLITYDPHFWQPPKSATTKSC